MTPRSPERDAELEFRLKQIDSLFDVQGMLDQSLTTRDIARYYVANRLSQRLWSSEGFFHFGISYDGRFKKDDLREPARLVEQYIRGIGASKVLELACGLGANCAFLARRNPDVTFDAIDVTNKPLKRYKTLPNLHFRVSDYHDLSSLRARYDLVFIIEALCCSTDKPQVLREVKQKLKPGGMLIVLDGYQRHRAIPLNRSEERMWALIEKSLSVDKIESIDDVEAYMRDEYSIETAHDLSAHVLPSISRFTPSVHFFFDHPACARIISRLLPSDVMKNTIHILLMPIGLQRQIACYYMHVLTNDRV